MCIAYYLYKQDISGINFCYMLICEKCNEGKNLFKKKAKNNFYVILSDLNEIETKFIQHALKRKIENNST